MNVESTLATLVQRGYVEEVGHDPGPGHAVLYGTTTAFLERLGLDSLADLPPLGDFVPDAVGRRGARARPAICDDDPRLDEPASDADRRRELTCADG